MTNAEKFKEVFGFKPHDDLNCIAPKKVCSQFAECEQCPFNNWWDKNYLPCFKIKEGLDD